MAGLFGVTYCALVNALRAGLSGCTLTLTCLDLCGHLLEGPDGRRGS